jgi:DNA mismatch endonuclease (patch repair protein)
MDERTGARHIRTQAIVLIKKGQVSRLEGRKMSGKDEFTPAERSAIMARVRSWNTTPERMGRSALHKLGYRYRLYDNRLPGKPDLIFASRRIALFVHGCFSHRHPNCKRASTPVAHQDYWANKFQRTMTRDSRNRFELEQSGWTVLVIWECQLRNLDWLPEIKSALDAAKPLRPPHKLRM